jgi:methionine sulfoxide reductase heme-binding subunit
MVLAQSLTWTATRAGGLLAFALLTIAVLIGIGLAGRARLERWPRFALDDLHRFTGLLAGSFVAVHVLVLLIDGFMPFSLIDLVVPGAAGYRPLATALGIVAMELMVALALTNRYRNRLSYRTWRRAHYLNFAVWLAALVHGILSGTDTRTLWATGLYAVAGASVAGLLVWRIFAAAAARDRRVWQRQPELSPARVAPAEQHPAPLPLPTDLALAAFDRWRPSDERPGQPQPHGPPDACAETASVPGSATGSSSLEGVADSRLVDSGAGTPRDLSVWTG